MTIASATGVIAGALSYTTAGTYPVTISVSDGTTTVTQSFTWTVVRQRTAGSDQSRASSTTPTAWITCRPCEPTGRSHTGASRTWRETPPTRIGQHTGTRYGLIATGQPGVLVDGSASNRFNGSNAFVRVPNAAALQLTGDLTIELWVNGSLATRQTLISKNHLREFELTLEKTGALNLYHGNGSGTVNVMSTSGAVLAESSGNTWS